MTIPTVQEMHDAKEDLDDLEAIVNGSTTVSTRTGGDKLSVDQALSLIMHGTITTYSAATTYTAMNQWVEQSNIVYRPRPSQLPIGPESFDSSKWIVASGVIADSSGNVKINGITDGIEVLGSTDAALGSTQDARIEIKTQTTNELLAEFGFDGVDANLNIRNYNHGGEIHIIAENSSGSNILLFSGAPNVGGNVQIYNEGTSVWRGQTPANGGMQVNNQSTGSGFGRVLTLADKPLSAHMTAVEQRTNTTTMTDSIIRLDNIPLGVYAFRFFVVWSQSSTDSQGIRFTFNAQDSLAGNFHYQLAYDKQVSGEQNLLTVANAVGFNATWTYNMGAQSSNEYLSATGFLEVTTSGDLVLQWAQETANANETSIHRGYMMLVPMHDLVS